MTRSGNGFFRTPEGYFTDQAEQIEELQRRLVLGGGGGGGDYQAQAGLMQPYGGGGVPSGWLLCDGSAVLRAAYPDLFAAIGTTWGIGNGTTTFNLPDLRGRVPVGRDATQTEFDTVGETGGAKTHTLTIAEIPAHSHDQRVTAGTGGPAVRTDYTGDAAGQVYPQGITTGPIGGGGAHNNLQPYAVANWVISTGAGVGGGGSNVPALPAPWVGAYNGTLNITPAAGVWADIDTVGLSRTITLAQPMWVMVEMSGYMTGTAAAYGMIGVNASGALNLAPETDQATLSAAWFGYTAFSEQAAYAGKTLTAHKPLLIPAGTTTLRMQARRSTASGTPTLGYPTMIVTPINWVGAPADPSLLSRGTSAMRDAVYGVPATDGARVALANSQVEWYNTEKGWTETYYAPTGLTGLGVPGLRAGNAAGWYPIAGSPLYITVQRNASLTASGAGGTIPFDSIWLQRNIPFTAGAAAVVVPYGGDYEVSGSAVAAQNSGNYIDLTLRRSTTSLKAQTGTVFPHTSAYSRSDIVPMIVGATAGQNFDLFASSSSAGTIVAETSILTVKYLGPPLS